MPVLNHRHDWAGTSGGYACLTCAATITDTEVRLNPAPAKGVSAPEHVERKLGK